MVFPSACPRCGSTDRTPYYHTRTLAITGRILGQPYDHIVYRYTRCRACGQHRVDRHYEFRSPPDQPTDSKSRTDELDNQTATSDP